MSSALREIVALRSKPKEKLRKHGTGGRIVSDDLISRKSLIENLRTFAPERYDALVNDLIMKEPKAFDKEKVIEQLNRCRVYQFQGMLPDGRVCHFSDVVEIVEKGGIE